MTDISVQEPQGTAAPRKQVTIENPIINSPFEEPQRHFRFGDEGITNEIVPGRRNSIYWVPVPRPRSRKAAPADMFGWTEDRIQENKFIDQLRGRVSLWRQGGHVRVTNTTKRLLKLSYTVNGEERQYFPNFLGRMRTPDGSPLNLIIEVSGQRKREKKAKASTAVYLWLPAVNGRGKFRKWRYFEVKTLGSYPTN